MTDSEQDSIEIAISTYRHAPSEALTIPPQSPESKIGRAVFAYHFVTIAPSASSQNGLAVALNPRAWEIFDRTSLNKFNSP